MHLAKTAETTTPTARLAVWRARGLLALWAAVALTFLAVFAVDLPLSYRQMATSCVGPDCHYQAITPAEAAVLAGWGLSAPAYALYMLGISVVPVVVISILAILMLIRLYPQARAFLFSLMVIAIPVTAITNFDVVAAAYPRLTIPIQFIVVIGQWLLMAFILVFPRSQFDPRWTLILPFLAAFFGIYPLFLVELFTMPIAQSYTILLILAVAVIVFRYRRLFDETERRQTKWVILGILILLTGVPFWTYIFEISTPAAGRDSLLLVVGGWTLLMLMTLALPVTIFVSIFRHQLWDIDLILNRTLVYGGLTAGIIAVYALIVGGLGALLHTQSNFLLSLMATGLIAILFQPVRERLQRAVNRLMFGERDDPYAVLSKLGRRLQDTAVPDQTLSAITATITQTLKLPFAAVEVETVDGKHRPVAVDGRRPAAVVEWPLRYQGQVIGRLVVAPRSPRDAFTAEERKLLADIASQAGAAAYAVRLTTALQQSRERLVLAREEERRRIRRDLHDELGPALASQTFQMDAALDLIDTDPTAAAEVLMTLKSRNQSLVGDIRRLVYELRPPALDELGLLGALRAHWAQINLPTVTVYASPDPLPALPAAVEVAAYRIALEAVNNVVRHAAASHCLVTVTEADSLLTLKITDDGSGLPSGVSTGIGLRSMRERAEEVGGLFTVEKAIDSGVVVTAVFPTGVV